MNPQDNIIVHKGLFSVHTKASFHMSIKTNLIRHLQNKAPPKVPSGHFVQVFNLDTKDKLGVFHSTENVVFWR